MFQLLTIFNVIWKGMLVGIIASAPMGPVGVLCIQRTLNKGRWYGFVTGCGAALSDLLYALLTGYGMSFVFETVNNNVFWLQILGCILLGFFGVYTFFSNPVKAYRSSRQSGKNGKGTYTHNFITAFLLTFSNPLIIFLFIALFARFSFVASGRLVSSSSLGYVSIICGALLWWYLITFLVSKLRNQINLHGIRNLNRVIGGLVTLLSLLALIGTFMGKSFEIIS